MIALLAFTALLFAGPSFAGDCEHIFTYMGELHAYRCENGVIEIRDRPLYAHNVQVSDFETAAITAQAEQVAGQTKSPDGIRVTRVYKSSDKYYRAVIATNRAVWVKCAGLDRSQNHLSVSTSTQIKPPADEVIIRAAPGFSSVSCWVDQ